MSKRAAVGFCLAGFALIAALRFSAGCGSEPNDRSPSDGGVDAVVAADSADASPDVHDESAADSTVVTGWEPLGWPPGCDLEYAKQPGVAFPKQEWIDCGLPGCTKLNVSFPYDDFEPFTAVRAGGSGANARFSFVYVASKSAPTEWRRVILDRNGSALAVIRTSTSTCGGHGALSQSGAALCLLVPTFGGPNRAAILPAAGVSSLTSSFESAASIDTWCTDELFASLDQAGNPHIRDLSANTEYPLKPPSGQAFDPRLHGDRALFIRRAVEAGNEVIDGWMWKRPNVLEKLVDPGTQKVFDIRTDGMTLVWLQITAPDIYDAYPGDLWTSPMAPTRAGLKPTKRRAVPPTTIFIGNHAIGGGYYAIVEGSLSTTNTRVHVYRLSDARHWEAPNPPGLVNSTLVLVDDQEVWFMARLTNGLNTTLVRQRLDALGPGD